MRKAYNTLVFELNSAELVNTLGRATVSICDELCKHKIPTDDPEPLCVFLVVSRRNGEPPGELAYDRNSRTVGKA